jgi:hypothetical protein
MLRRNFIKTLAGIVAAAGLPKALAGSVIEPADDSPDLMDYEDGFFTPKVTNPECRAQGTYTRIGRTVYLNTRLELPEGTTYSSMILPWDDFVKSQSSD